MSIDSSDVSKSYSFNHNITFTESHAAWFKRGEDAWGCECRIRTGVLQGHVLWSGISRARSYSQWHSRSPWKDILGCIAERLEYQRSKTLIMQTGGSGRAGMCRMWRALSLGAQWHSEESLKCHFKLRDGGSVAGVWGELGSQTTKPKPKAPYRHQNTLNLMPKWHAGKLCKEVTGKQEDVCSYEALSALISAEGIVFDNKMK